MLFLRAKRKGPVRSTRHRGGPSPRLTVEVLEDRTLPTAYTFTPLTEAVTVGVTGQLPLLAPAINNSGDVAFFANFFRGAPGGGIYVARGGAITTIAQDGSAGLTHVGENNVGVLSINASGVVAFTAFAGPSPGIFTGDGTTTPTAILPDYNAAFPMINDSGEVAFMFPVATPAGSQYHVFLYDGGEPRDLTPYDPFQQSLLDPLGFNNNGQVAFFAANSVQTLLYVTDGSTRTLISSTGPGFFPLEPNVVNPGRRPTIDDSGTVAFIAHTAAGDGVYTGNGGPLTLLASDTSNNIYYPTINNNGDVAYDVNFGHNGVFLYNGVLHTTDKLIQDGDPLNGLTFVQALAGPTLNDSGQIAFVAQLFDPGSQATYYQLFRADPVPPKLSIGNATVTEGSTGMTAANFTVTLSEASGKTVTVNYATADGTGTTADSDYQAASDTLTFAPGETSKTVTVLVNGDTTFEPDEMFSVSLSGPTNATIATGTGTGTIQNDDPQPSIAIDSVTAPEGNSGATPFAFTVRLSNPSYQTITVDFATGGGTATAGTDYVSTSDTLTFAPGVVTQPITVLVNGDTTDEFDLTFGVILSNPGNATIAVGTGTGTILNDDQPPQLSIDDVSLVEGNSGATAFTFSVSLSEASGKTVTVNFATADDTATAGSDYQATGGTLTFAPGDLTKTFTVLVNGDTTVEPDETFFVNLSAAANATITIGTGTGTILNNDSTAAVTLSIDDVTHYEGNSGTTPFVLTVSLSAPATSAVTVKYATADGTATSHGRNADYTKVRGKLTFSPGETDKTITVLVNGDTLVEPDETFFVNLSAPSGATIADSQAVGTILNDDGSGSGPSGPFLPTRIPGVSPLSGRLGIGAAVAGAEFGPTDRAHDYRGASRAAISQSANLVGALTKTRNWLLVSAPPTRNARGESLSLPANPPRQETLVVQPPDRLLNMPSAEDIDQKTLAHGHTGLRDRLVLIKLKLKAVDRAHDETAEFSSF
jgi:hypothetical protein